MAEKLYDDFAQHLGEGVVILVFTAPWCTYCPQLKDQLYEYKDDEISKGVAVLECDVDVQPDIAGDYGVMGLPTMVFFKAGEVAKKVSGVKRRAEIEKIVEEIKNG